MLNVVLLLVLVVAAFAARVNIDPFTVPSGNLIYDPKSGLLPQSSTTVDNNILGGARDLYITAPGGSGTKIIADCATAAAGSSNPTAQVPVTNSGGAPSGLYLSNPSVQCAASALVRYDGLVAPVGGCDYYSAGCVPTGTLNLNLASATTFSVTAGADLSFTYFAVFLYSGSSDSSNYCGAYRNINGNTQGPTVYGQNFNIPLSEFKQTQSPPAGTGLASTDFPQTCDLSNINAIEVQLIGGLNWDQSLFVIGYDVPDLIQISGAAFDDCNCQGSTSAAKNGVTVQLFSGSSCSGTAAQTTTTSGNGAYSFNGLQAGTYTVCTNSGNLCNSANARTVSQSSTGINFFFVVNTGVLTCPAAATVTCGQDTSTTSLGNAAISSGCGAAGAVTQSPDQVTTTACTTPGGVIQTITRTWTSGSATCSQTITVRDNNVKPVLSNVPAGVTLDCNAADPTDVPSVSGSCSNPRVQVSNTGTGNGQCDVNSCSRSSVSTRTFTPVDDCGNQGNSATQTITRSCATVCPTCAPCVPQVIPATTTAPAPRPVVGPLNCKFICDDADSSAVSVMVSIAMLVVLAFFML